MSSSFYTLEIEKSLNIQPKEIYKSRDYLLIYENQSDIEQIEINRNFFDKINLGFGGVVVSSKGDHVDFVSRYFHSTGNYFRRSSNRFFTLFIDSILRPPFLRKIK